MYVTFEHIVYLWFLVLIPLLVAIHFYSLHFARQKAMRFANFEALEKIVQTKSVVPKNYALLAMRCVTLVGFTLAASGITLHYDTPAAAYDYVVALDTSNSMMASDLAPTRLDAAKAAVSGWAVSLPQGSHVGIITFSSQANLLLEPTGDMAQVKRSVDPVIIDKSGGTALCEALKSGTNWLDTSKNPRAIILISDGQNNAGCLLDDGIEYAKRGGVTVFTVGVGSQAGGKIEGVKNVTFMLEEADLERVANGTDGKYYRAADNAGFTAAFAELSMPGMMKQSLPLAIPLMIISFIFVFADWGLSITRYRTIP